MFDQGDEYVLAGLRSRTSDAEIQFASTAVRAGIAPRSGQQVAEDEAWKVLRRPSTIAGPRLRKADMTVSAVPG
jgi:hypothetical protein